MPRKNIYDWFIIFVIASFVFGTVQVWILGQHVVVGLFSLPYAIKEVSSSIRTFRFKPIVFFLLLWFIYASFSILWSIAVQPIEYLWTLFWVMVIFLALLHCSCHANFPIRSFMQGWLLLLVLTYPIAFWEIISGKHLAKWGDFNAESSIALVDGGTQQRVFAAVTYKNLNSYVTLLCMALPMAFAAIVELKHKIYPFVISFVAACLVLINASRGGFVCIIADIVVLFFFYRQAHFRYKRFVSVLLFGCLLLFVVNFGFLIIEQLIGRLENVDSFTEDAGRWDVLQLGLLLLWDSGGFGWGVGSMVSAYETTGFWLYYAHNMVMEFWVQYGLFLSIPFGWLLLKAVLNLSQKSKFTSLRIYGWLVMCSFLPIIIIDDSYFGHPYVWGFLSTMFSMYHLDLQRNRK